MSRAALKANKSMYSIVLKVDQNTRAVAKLVSAIDYVRDAGEQFEIVAPAEALALLELALFNLLQQRRNLRLELEDAVKAQKR